MGVKKYRRELLSAATPKDSANYCASNANGVFVDWFYWDMHNGNGLRSSLYQSFQGESVVA